MEEYKMMQDSVVKEDPTADIIEGEVVTPEASADVNGDAKSVEGEVLEDTEKLEQEAEEKNPEAKQEKTEYTNVFAKLMNKIASAFPEGNQFRNVFTGMADNLEAALGHHGYTAPSASIAGNAAGIAGGLGAVSSLQMGSALGGAGLGAGMKLKDQVTQNKQKIDEHETYANGVGKAVVSASKYLAAGDFLSKDSTMLGKVSDTVAAKSEKLTDVTVDTLNASSGKGVRDSVSKDYCTMFESLHTFDQDMRDQISETYTGKEKEQAMDKLGSYMNAMVGPIRGSMYASEQQAGPFLTDADRQKLDSMEFTGVKDTYSEYAFERDMKQDDLDMEDDFGDDIRDITEEPYAAPTDSQQVQHVSDLRRIPGLPSADVKSGKRDMTRGRDYGKLAQERLGNVKDDRSSELQAGMEL